MWIFQNFKCIILNEKCYTYVMKREHIKLSILIFLYKPLRKKTAMIYIPLSANVNFNSVIVYGKIMRPVTPWCNLRHTINSTTKEFLIDQIL